MMPYAGMSNDQVAAAVCSGMRLSQPAACPDAIFAILVQCWAFKPANRPTFQQLSKRLASVIRRVRQGATDNDLMQSPMLRRSAAPEGLVSARPLTEKRTLFHRDGHGSRSSFVGNEYLASPTNSQREGSVVDAGIMNDYGASYTMMNGSSDTDMPPPLIQCTSAGSFDDVSSRPLDDHLLAGTFVRFNDLSVEDGTIVLEPQQPMKGESLRMAMQADNSILHQYLDQQQDPPYRFMGAEALDIYGDIEGEYLTITREQASLRQQQSQSGGNSGVHDVVQQQSASSTFEGGAI